jgi:hypothetical protein
VLREISAQTAENSAATTNSIGKLAQLSNSLRKSVAGFRLPEGLIKAQEPAAEAPAARPAAPAKAARPVGRMTA